MKVTSAHTGNSVELSELERAGAEVTRVNDQLLRVEFPAKNGVGPIGGFWRTELGI